MDVLATRDAPVKVAAAAPRDVAVEAAPEEATAGLRKRADRGSYKVSGLGNRKKAILGAGGTTLDLAIAMLETENMQTLQIWLTYDAANFGLFKQNWGMLRACAWRYGFKGQSQNNWNNGNRLKCLTRSPPSLSWDVYADVASRWDCQEYYGYDKWFARHRNGATGLKNPYTNDINNHKSAVQWIQKQIDSNSKYKTDDTRFWVNVMAI
ncbi:hypothetical protein C8A05DRAFT_47983 [Staphylotrichum tortipilum]|uniref:Uncharacterized protein n=1 Tax=Staphylotrichum tortipilum TaxID=2831512 RepID=A0AAN6MC75_9PEZI|nr:hypothetical protein C8A05DRAFT_47983 [Staphylotrichum longicolle]